MDIESFILRDFDLFAHDTIYIAIELIAVSRQVQVGNRVVIKNSKTVIQAQVDTDSSNCIMPGWWVDDDIARGNFLFDVYIAESHCLASLLRTVA